jgi:hypothetical protein
LSSLNDGIESLLIQTVFSKKTRVTWNNFAKALFFLLPERLALFPGLMQFLSKDVDTDACNRMRTRHVNLIIGKKEIIYSDIYYLSI